MKTGHTFIIILALFLIGCSNDDETIINTEQEGTNTAPLEAKLLGPINGAEVQQFLNITLSWKGEDPDNDPLTYDILLGKRSNQLEVLVEGIEQESYTIDFLTTGETIYWKVISKDPDGLISESDINGFNIYENIFEGDYTITSNEDLESFAANGYTKIIGDLSIANVTKSESNDLKTLNKLEGSLFIKDTNFSNFDGLNNLEILKGDLSIRSNDFLKNITGLSKIQKLEKSIFIEGNPLLSSLQGVENINQSMEGYISIQSNTALTNLSPLSNLLYVSNDIYITGNGNITNLDGLQNLQATGGSLVIGDESNLSSVGLNNFQSVNSLRLINIGKITEINFENLTVVRGNISIQSNNILTNINGFENITGEISEGLGLFIINNPLLTNIESLQNLTTLEELKISKNIMLKEINFNKLLNVQEIELNENDNLINIQMGNLESVTDNFEIIANPLLTDYCSLASYASIALTEQKEITTEGNLYNPTTEMISTREECRL
ncbi:hypothetical protein D1815_21860 [Aquimarina sp. AD1]|uniref:hypothetical protein n=1 Tax=Aquimarina sp. (strain AD1) TaxID=1714848 RepID=UPI000E50231C|nr:hypothetical protein [Aquimarina sp. AD1]AXT58280.1 hypothetical protein D1815_21860 [Aquimarina sp. AD1]RKN36085.1 hypothetical protein D7035_02390 [Aquimarina sp. AD1]